jgi:NitT/TauT family transport system permease protein
MQVLYERGRLEPHIMITFKEAIYGLALSIGLALPLGYGVAKNRWLSALLMPYLVAIRAIPVVAIAALIVIWLGTDIKSKVFVVTFITWFPLMEATVVGIQSVDNHLRDLMRAYRANPLQVFWKLELPAALPNIFSGLKVSATLAVVGAAVGELIGSSKGLAYLILYGRGTSDAPLVFGSVGLLTAMSLLFYAVVVVLEVLLLRWRKSGAG